MATTTSPFLDDTLHTIGDFMDASSTSCSASVSKQWRWVFSFETFTPNHILSLTKYQLKKFSDSISSGVQQTSYPFLFARRTPLTDEHILNHVFIGLRAILLPRCTSVTDVSILAVAASCKDLHSLDVSDTDGAITDVSILAVAASCKDLHSLDVRGTGGAITDVSLRAFQPSCSVTRD